MNSFVETLDHWGGNFLSFAWPMFWQSGLLIAVMFGFDFLLRRKIRASVRYALWLVVLVKLCVPPTLALPTSPAWWLHKTSPPAVIKPAAHYTVTYDNSPLPEIPQTSLPIFVPPKPAMNLAASLLVISVSISSALFLWLLVRWWQITQQVHRAKTSERLAALADEAQKIVGMKFKVQVKLTTNSMSPAVCGLFRPAILISQSLVENFSDEQLRAVLLHELIHLRRCDVWLNFLQALLQIFYWWHPLVWLANARIRRVREEAVDDAVMLALHDEAETYAPTLLEVAKLALNRPLASLGLVGILESRHALRQRIERLVDFRAPRQAGLTLVSLLGILAFTAVAVPMGEGPDKAVESAKPQTAKKKVPWPDPNFEGYNPINLQAQFLVIDESELRTGVPSLANNRQPTLISTNEADVLLTQLKQGGARFYNDYPDGIQQPAISGAPQCYRIGGGTNQIGAVTCLTTNAGGSFSNMIAGFDIQMPANQPDWTPMNLTLRALAQKDGTHFEMSVAFPIAGNNSQQIEITVPHGKAMVWASNPPNASGKCQIVLLIPSENSDAYSTSPILTRISENSDQPNSSDITNLPSVLITSHIYQMRDAEFGKIISGLKFNQAGPGDDSWWSASPEKFSDLAENLRSSGLDTIAGPRIQTANGEEADMYVGNGTKGVWFDCTPLIASKAIGLIISGKVVDASAKISVTNQFSAKASAENYGGIVIRAKSAGGESNLVVVAGVEIITNGEVVPQDHAVATNAFEEKTEAGQLVQDGKLLYEMGKLDDAKVKLEAALALDPENAAAKYYLGLVQSARQGPKISYVGPGRQMIVSKLDRIRLERVAFKAVPLREVIQNLSDETKKNDPDRQGINYMLTPNPPVVTPMIIPRTGLPAATNAVWSFDLRSLPITINPALTNIRLGDVLDAVVKAAPEPIQYSVEDYAIVFSPKGPDLPELYTRTFKVDKIVFTTALQKATGLQTTNVSVMAENYFSTLGVDLTSAARKPEKLDATHGKSIFFNDRLGELFVRGTEQDLDTIKHAIEMHNMTPPQIHIKARFVAVRQDDGKSFGFDWYLGQFGSNNVAGTGGSSPPLNVPVSASSPSGAFPSNTVAPVISSVTGILTDPNLRVVLHALENRPGFEQLAEPEGITTSGRQMQMRSTDIITVVTNIAFRENGTNEPIIPQLEQLETGPVLDVVPYVLADGYMLDLNLQASFTNFLGYDQPTNTTSVYNKAGEKIDLPVTLPRIEVSQASTHLNIWDGQTVVLGGLIISSTQTTKDKVPFLGNLPVMGRLFQSQSKMEIKENLIVFVTATIVDSTGNPVHSAEEMSAKDGIPAQPNP